MAPSAQCLPTALIGSGSDFKLHPDKQFGRDADSQRRTALAWQKVSDAYEKAKLELAPASPSDMGAAAREAAGAEEGAAAGAAGGAAAEAAGSAAPAPPPPPQPSAKAGRRAGKRARE